MEGTFMSTAWFVVGALLGALGVVIGAFAAHGLEGRVEPRLLSVFETAVRYHMYHALALLAVAWAVDRWPSTLTALSGWAFVAGILVFCGSLYLMTLTGARWLGAVTPLGGLAFILGWALLAAGVWRGTA
jgi:uncharacterized membrane protein YgdD (TMEM256/DUF423 family)